MSRMRQVAVRTVRRPAALKLEWLEDRCVLDAAGPGALPDLTIDLRQAHAAHVLVWLQPGADAAHLASYGTVSALTDGLYQIDLAPGLTVDKTIEALDGAPGVRAAEPDYVINLAQTPNDPSYSSQWALPRISAPTAWDTTTGQGNVVVAVIDTGIDYNHQDLSANMWKNPGETAGNGIDDDANGFVDDVYGADFHNNDGNPMDDNSHGTHVAGTIAAVGNNGVGVTGVAWGGVKLMALKFLSASGSGYTSNAIRAIEYAANKGAAIANNSWGGGGYSQSLYDAINGARSSGLIFVAAAGNSGTNNDSSAFYPANYNLDNVVSVASTTSSDVLSSFSNYGATTVDLAAPGSSILSTTPNNTYSTYSGTSMATPHVSGALALVRGLHSDWTYSQVIAQVLNNVDTLSSLSGKVVTGGRLNLAKAVGSAASDVTGPRVTGIVLLSTRDAVRVTFSEPIDGTTFSTDDATLTGPSGTVALTGVAAVANTNNTQFDVRFAPLSAGNYTLELGPDVRDLANNQMDQNANGTNGEAADRYVSSPFTVSTTSTYSATPNLTIRDRRTVWTTITVGQAFTVGDLNVTVNLTHTAVGDLLIKLRSPSGTEIVLFDHKGGLGNDLTNSVFDDQATVSLAQGSAPFTGSFRPEQALSAFIGAGAAGTWRLTISDTLRYDSGRLVSWSLTFEPQSSGQARAVLFEALTGDTGAVEGGTDGAGEAAPVTAPLPGTVVVVVTPAPLEGPEEDRGRDLPFFGSEREEEGVLVEAPAPARRDIALVRDAVFTSAGRRADMGALSALVAEGEEDAEDEWDWWARV